MSDQVTKMADVALEAILVVSADRAVLDAVRRSEDDERVFELMSKRGQALFDLGRAVDELQRSAS